jgi:hypothetical protein
MKCGFDPVCVLVDEERMDHNIMERNAGRLSTFLPLKEWYLEAKKNAALAVKEADVDWSKFGMFGLFSRFLNSFEEISTLYSMRHGMISGNRKPSELENSPYHVRRMFGSAFVNMIGRVCSTPYDNAKDMYLNEGGYKIGSPFEVKHDYTNRSQKYFGLDMHLLYGVLSAPFGDILSNDDLPKCKRLFPMAEAHRRIHVKVDLTPPPSRGGKPESSSLFEFRKKQDTWIASAFKDRNCIGVLVCSAAVHGGSATRTFPGASVVMVPTYSRVVGEFWVFITRGEPSIVNLYDTLSVWSWKQTLEGVELSKALRNERDTNVLGTADCVSFGESDECNYTLCSMTRIRELMGYYDIPIGYASNPERWWGVRDVIDSDTFLMMGKCSDYKTIRKLAPCAYHARISELFVAGKFPGDDRFSDVYNSQTHFIRHFPRIASDILGWDILSGYSLRAYAASLRDDIPNDREVVVSGHMLNMLLITWFRPIDFPRYLKTILWNLHAYGGNRGARKLIKRLWEEGVLMDSVLLEEQWGLWHDWLEYDIAVDVYEDLAPRLGMHLPIADFVRGRLKALKRMKSFYFQSGERDLKSRPARIVV